MLVPPSFEVCPPRRPRCCLRPLRGPTCVSRDVAPATALLTVISRCDAGRCLSGTDRRRKWTDPSGDPMGTNERGPCLRFRRSEASHVVREGGVEPPHPFEYTDLNRARLPIPPLARAEVKLARRVTRAETRAHPSRSPAARNRTPPPRPAGKNSSKTASRGSEPAIMSFRQGPPDPGKSLGRGALISAFGRYADTLAPAGPVMSRPTRRSC